MVAPTAIRSLSVRDLNIPLTAPFGIAGGAQDIARNLLVTVELADGTRGYGEAAPFPAFNGETQDAARDAINAIRVKIEGADVREWRQIGLVVRREITKAASARCAIETALLDALTRRAQLPLWVYFGGASRTLETDMTITTGSVDEAITAALDIQQRGIQTIKIKIGAGDLQLDIERIIAVHNVVPDAPILLDGNGGLSADSALNMLGALHIQGVAPVLFEQPVPRDDWAGLRQVAQWGGVTVATDESVTTPAEALRLAFEHAAQVANIKLMKSGIMEGLEIFAICRAAGIGLMIGGMVESILAMTTSACFAAGLGGFRFVDLDTPMFMTENPFIGGFEQRGATLDLSNITAGHGVTPR
ncbi:dipeptide epimerase [Candidatus Gracilibacteria bacterium]|nr:dipeptide epimerase [Candidatus Gracilibacteria bacterium]